MANITVTANIAPGSGGYYYKYRKLSGGPWSSFINVLTNPFTFVTTDPIHTNYEVQVYNNCGNNISSTSSKQTNFLCTCGITSIQNLIVSACNPIDLTYSVTVDVTFTCMMNDMGKVTNVITAQIGSGIWYFNPTQANGTQTIIITGLVSDGASHTLSVTCQNS